MTWRIKLHRSSQDNELYFSEPFTRWQARQDLILFANHADWSIVVRGNIIQLKRGQNWYSEETLAKRWKWSRGKVRRYLKYLETIQQIEQQKSSVKSTITIINYNKFQWNSTTDSTTDGHQTVQQTDTNNKDNNKKEEYITELEDVIKQRNWQPEFLKLPKTIKTTQAIKDTRCTRRQEYTLEEVKMSINAYLINIKNRVDDGKWFFHHRFTFYDFIKQSNWLQKFINNQPQW